MRNHCQVAIGMPVLNGGKSISKSLDALLAQTFGDFEVSVIDNSSNDDSFNIARSYAAVDNRVKVYRFPRVTAGENFYRAFENAKSDHFMWAADDDYWDPNFLETAVEALKDSEFKYCSPNWWVGDIASGRGASTTNHPLAFLGNEDRRARTLNFANLHHLSHRANLVYALYTREFLARILARKSVANDGIFTNLIASEGRGVILDDVLFKKQFIAGRSSRIVDKLSFMNGFLGSKAPLISKALPGSAKRAKEFSRFKSQSLQELVDLFPEYAGEIRTIYLSYDSYSRSPFIIDEKNWVS